MNQRNELIVLIVLLLILLLKPNHVMTYIKTHLGRLIMVGGLAYLALKNYIYGIAALGFIILIHEMRVVEGNQNMSDSKNTVVSKDISDDVEDKEDETDEPDYLDNADPDDNSDDDGDEDA